MVTTQGGSHSRAGSRTAWLLFLICYGLACAVILLPRGSLTQTGHATIEASSQRRRGRAARLPAGVTAGRSPSGDRPPSL